MTKQMWRIALYSITVYLFISAFNSTFASPFHHERPENNRRYARALSDLNVGEPYMVRQIYFHPRDRQRPQDIDTTLDTLVREVQQFYADEMERHGFGRKTFRLETDALGKPVRHRITGKFTTAHYTDDIIHEASKEMDGQVIWEPDSIYLIWHDTVDVNSGIILGGQVGGTGGGGPFSGVANITLFSFDKAPKALYRRAFNTVVHELGHAFGLAHDFRDNRYMMSYGPEGLIDQFSFCAAEWLDAHRYFNTTHNAFFEVPSISMLEPALVSPPNTIRLRFELTHSARLHQAQLLTNSLVHRETPVFDPTTLIDCKSLNENNVTIELVTTELAAASEYVSLRVIDVHGNFTPLHGQRFPIDITTLYTDSERVLIPDANLEASIRRNLGLPPKRPITKLDMLGLGTLWDADPNLHNAQGVPPHKQIRDLTGLEHATNLGDIELNDNKIVDLTPLKGLTHLKRLNIQRNRISDVGPLGELTQLEDLWLGGNQISDVRPLRGLTNLITLGIGNNQISDIMPLTGLLNLHVLYLYGNQITDRTLTVLTEFTNLESLELSHNWISDISAVSGLTNLTFLSLEYNSISDISPVSGLTNLILLHLSGNSLNYPSIYTHIPTLRERGVEVEFDRRTPWWIRIVSGNNQQGLPGEALASPFVVEIQDYIGAAFEGVPVTFTVDSGGGTLSVKSAATDSNGQAESILTLGPEPGTNTVEVSVTGIQQKQTATAIGELPPVPEDVNRDEVVNILDLVLVSKALGDGGTDTAADVNGDGVVNILDLVLVVMALEGAAAAPAANP